MEAPNKSRSAIQSAAKELHDQQRKDQRRGETRAWIERRRAETMLQRKLHLHGARRVEVLSLSCPTEPWGSSITGKHRNVEQIISLESSPETLSSSKLARPRDGQTSGQRLDLWFLPKCRVLWSQHKTLCESRRVDQSSRKAWVPLEIGMCMYSSGISDGMWLFHPADKVKISSNE